MSRAPTLFWCNIFAIAAVLASLFMVVGQLYLSLAHKTEVEIFVRYYAVGVLFYPPAVSLWVKLRFFPPLRNEGMLAILLHWFFIHGVVSFLIGNMAALFTLVWHGGVGDCLVSGLILTIIELVLAVLLFLPLYFVFRMCRV